MPGDDFRTTQIQMQFVEEADLELARRRATTCVRRYMPANQAELVLDVLGLSDQKELIDMSDLVTYAQEELDRSGLLSPDSDYEGMLGRAALDIVALFASQGHSGMSAEMVTQIVAKLLRYEPLTPLTYEPDEWVEVSDGVWQNKRDFRVFSYDGGQTHTTVGS